jgi:hypothetical protein
MMRSEIRDELIDDVIASIEANGSLRNALSDAAGGDRSLRQSLNSDSALMKLVESTLERRLSMIDNSDVAQSLRYEIDARRRNGDNTPLLSMIEETVETKRRNGDNTPILSLIEEAIEDRRTRSNNVLIDIATNSRPMRSASPVRTRPISPVKMRLASPVKMRSASPVRTRSNMTVEDKIVEDKMRRASMTRPGDEFAVSSEDGRRYNISAAKRSIETAAKESALTSPYSPVERINTKRSPEERDLEERMREASIPRSGDEIVISDGNRYDLSAIRRGLKVAAKSAPVDSSGMSSSGMNRSIGPIRARSSDEYETSYTVSPLPPITPAGPIRRMASPVGVQNKATMTPISSGSRSSGSSMNKGPGCGCGSR